MGEDRGLERKWNRSWSVGFDAAADAYDEARPGYPSRLYEDLKNICSLGVATRVLEIGCGTGQATVDLAPLAKSIVALEPGASLAGKARTRLAGFKNVEVLTSTFEGFDGESGSFALVCSATAFHWVEPDVGFVRAAELLRPGGWLALWWTSYQDPDAEDTFGEVVSRLFDAHGSPGYSGLGYALRSDDRISDFTRSPGFGPVESRHYRWKGHHSAREMRTLFSTYSNVQAMDEPERRRILNEIEDTATTKFGGRVTRPYVTSLYAAQKVNEET